MARGSFILALALYLALFAVGGSAKKATAKASHILVKDEATANDLLEKVRGGADFAELAKEHSTCPSGKKGGDLGTFSQGQMVKPFDNVIFDPATELGTVYGPVHTQFGEHLIVVYERDGVESRQEL